MKYERVQSDGSLRSSLNSSLMYLELRPLNALTTELGEVFGSTEMNRCTWSGMTVQCHDRSMPFRCNLMNDILQTFLDVSSQYRLPPFRAKDDVIVD